MYQTRAIRTVSKAQSLGVAPVPPPYHWLGAGAEGAAAEPGEVKVAPFYFWLGAEAEKIAA